MIENYYDQIKWNEDELARWRNDDGDNTHLLNWNLSPTSRVVDIGSYRGDWIQKICKRYNCYGLGCEPTKQPFIESLPKSSEKISFMNYGITVDQTSDMTINIGSDESSFIKKIKDSKEETVKMLNAKELFYHVLGGYIIDLVQMNIEGYEYFLLPYMIDNGLLNNITAIQIQFHNISDKCDKKRQDICSRLKNIGFETKFDYNCVWYGGTKK